MRWRRGLVGCLVITLAVAAGCGSETPSSGGSGPVATTSTGFPMGPADPGWTAGADKGATVAVVDGVPLSLAMVQAQLDTGAFATPQEALDALVTFEILAQAAAKEGWASDAEVLATADRAMVQALVDGAFASVTTEASIPDEVIEQVYHLPSIRVKFDHYNAYKVVDVQIICCLDPPDQCQTPSVAACLDEKLEVMKNVRQALEGTYVDKDTLVTAVENLSFDYTGLRTQEYAFFWDPKRPPDAQSGFNVINSNVALAVLPLEIGELAVPVESKQGVHMPYLVKFDPEVHRTLDDPSVGVEIRSNIFPKYRKDKFAQYMTSLLEARSVIIYEQVLDVVYGAVE